MTEAKKRSPAEVWKILPIKHKIISVVVAIVVASSGAFAIYYVATGSSPFALSPARDLTGTWRNPISGQGLILESRVSDPKGEAGIAAYYDVEWKITQSGNTVAGPMTLKLVKVSGAWAINPAEVAVFEELSGRTGLVTGTVEGTGIIIDFGYGRPAKPLKGTFTTDIMTCTAYISPEEEEAWLREQWDYPPDVPMPTFIGHGYRAKLSLSRV